MRDQQGRRTSASRSQRPRITWTEAPGPQELHTESAEPEKSARPTLLPFALE